jgi:hypothetical protein
VTRSAIVDGAGWTSGTRAFDLTVKCDGAESEALEVVVGLVALADDATAAAQAPGDDAALLLADDAAAPWKGGGLAISNLGILYRRGREAPAADWGGGGFEWGETLRLEVDIDAQARLLVRSFARALSRKTHARRGCRRSSVTPASFAHAHGGSADVTR